TYCPITRSSLAPDSLPIIPSDAAGDQPILAARRPYGRGDIILVAAELRELTDSRRTTLDPLYLLRPLVGLKREVTREEDHFGLSEDLFRYIEQQTGFQVTTGLYLL